jgi:hypothetical protein
VHAFLLKYLSRHEQHKFEHEKQDQCLLISSKIKQKALLLILAGRGGEMKREAQPLLSEDGQHALDQYTQVLQHIEDLSPVTLRNYLSDLRQFIAWCEYFWRDMQEDHTFTPQAVAPSLLIRYRDYLQTTLRLKPSTVNRTLMSLKCYFSWTKKNAAHSV